MLPFLKMRKTILLFLGLFLATPSYAANIHTACVAVDEISSCDCKARNGISNSPRDEKKYAICLAEIKKIEDFSEDKQKLEEKQKLLEAKQAELEKKQKELEMKAEAMEVKAKFTPEAELAKSALGNKASILESLVPIIKSKDEAAQKKVSLILETFKASKDEYTRNVGIYLDYLLK